MSRVAMRVIVLVGILVGWSSPALADPIIVDFESFNSEDSLADVLPDLIFSNATVLTAGISLGEGEFPPNSGSNVIFDDGSPMRVGFDAPAISFGAYFTYLAPLTLQAFDSSGVLLGSVFSMFSNNLQLSGEGGSAPNEFLSLAFTGMAFVTISGDAGGGSFVLDDLSYELGAPDLEPIPEPSTLLLVGTGAGVLLRKRFTRRARRE